MIISVSRTVGTLLTRIIDLEYLLILELDNLRPYFGDFLLIDPERALQPNAHIRQLSPCMVAALLRTLQRAPIVLQSAHLALNPCLPLAKLGKLPIQILNRCQLFRRLLLTSSLCTTTATL